MTNASLKFDSMYPERPAATSSVIVMRVAAAVFATWSLLAGELVPMPRPVEVRRICSEVSM